MIPRYIAVIPKTYGAVYSEHPEGDWVKWADVSARLQQLEAEKETLHARLAVAEHHKVLSLLGKSSWQEVVEDKLRIELAETQVALAETRDALHQLQEKYDELEKAARGDGR